MSEDRLDLIEYLKSEVLYYEKRLAQAKAALRAALATTTTSDNNQIDDDLGEDYIPTGVKWSKEVQKIFREVGEGVELSVEEVCDRLTQKGIPCKSARARNNVQTAMARKHGNYLWRTEPGRYRLMTQEDEMIEVNKSEGEDDDGSVTSPSSSPPWSNG